MEKYKLKILLPFWSSADIKNLLVDIIKSFNKELKETIELHREGVYSSIDQLGYSSYLFHPSKYLKDPSKLWTLSILLDDDEILNHLLSISNVVDDTFIKKAISKVDIPFYLSNDGNYLFAAPFEVYESYGPLKKLSCTQALELTSVPVLETVVEKGSVRIN